MKALLGTLLRIALKIGGGYLTAKGIDAGDAAHIVEGAASAIAGGILSLVNHAKHRTSSSVKITNKLPMLLAIATAASLSSGCARFSSHQVKTQADGTRIEQTQHVTTFLDAKSDIAKLRASTTEQTQGLSVGGISQESSGTNAVDLVDHVVRAAVSSAIGAPRAP